jgi:hypothetical protein
MMRGGGTARASVATPQLLDVILVSAAQKDRKTNGRVLIHRQLSGTSASMGK